MRIIEIIIDDSDDSIFTNPRKLYIKTNKSELEIKAIIKNYYTHIHNKAIKSGDLTMVYVNTDSIIAKIGIKSNLNQMESYTLKNYHRPLYDYIEVEN